jgi:hypothetical protein
VTEKRNLPPNRHPRRKRRRCDDSTTRLPKGLKRVLHRYLKAREILAVEADQFHLLFDSAASAQVADHYRRYMTWSEK